MDAYCKEESKKVKVEREEATLRRSLAVLFFFGFCSSACLAQYSQRYRECSETALAQSQMNACAGEEATRAETEMQETYRTLLSRVQGQPTAINKIKATQDAWVRYRDAYLGAMYPENDKLANYGSIFPMEYSLLRTKLTRQHKAALNELLKQYNQ